MVTILTIGGIILVLGAIFMYFGKAYYSTMMYAVADLCWVTNAYQQNDIFGVISINIGIISGLAVMWKMKRGIFHKDLYIEKGKKNV